MAEPTTGDIVRYRPDEGFDQRIERAGRSEVRGLYADPHIWVLADDGVEHWVDGQRDVGFALEAG